MEQCTRHRPNSWKARPPLGSSRDEKGQSLIEMAIIMPLIIFILAGMFDFGRVIYAYVVVVNAAREAAIAGAVQEMSDSQLEAVIAEELERGSVGGGTASATFTYASQGDPEMPTLKVTLDYEIPLVILALPFATVTVRSEAETITYW